MEPRFFWFQATGQIDHEWYAEHWNHHISDVGLDVFVMISLSEVNVWGDDDTAAVAYLNAFKIVDNPDEWLRPEHTQPVHTISKCTDISVGLDVYGNIVATILWVVFA